MKSYHTISGLTSWKDLTYAFINTTFLDIVMATVNLYPAAPSELMTNAEERLEKNYN